MVELMTKQTTQELQKIIDDAPEGATHYAKGMRYLAFNDSGNWMRYDPNGFEGAKWFTANDYKFSYVKDFQSLDDIREILELRKEVQALKEQGDE